MQLEFESARLAYRPMRMDDLDLTIDLWTDPEVVKYLTDAPESVDKITAEMPDIIGRAGGGCLGIWCVLDKATGEKLGTAALVPLPAELPDTDWSLLKGGPIPAGDIEVGYILKRTAWGKGYAPEACARMLRFAFEGSPLEEIVAVTDPDHAASQHILHTCGLQPIGRVRAYQEDLPGFRITKAQWLAQHG
ncbi:MAG: GNAT family N-acetyltransferase [Roseovarius sp.]